MTDVSGLIACLCLVPFFTVSAVHLVQCVQQKHDMADKTKVLLMPLLLFYYIAASVICGRPLYWQLVAALVFSTEGDSFLIREDDPYRVKWGIISFSLAQVCFIVFSVMHFAEAGFPVSDANVWIIIGIYAVLYIVMVLVMYPHTVKYRNIIPLYTFVICMMSCLFLISAVTDFSWGRALMAAGGIVFMGSDAVLSWKMFVNPPSPALRVWVMAAYIAAEFLIILGGMLAI